MSGGAPADTRDSLISWRDGIDRLATSWINVTRSRPAAWHSEIVRFREKHEHLRLAGHWLQGPADLLHVLGLGRREIYHSAALAWLLNPEAHHGLGDGFLCALVTAVSPEVEFVDVGPVTVKREVSRDGRKADIIVLTSALILVIENKVLAPESANQCNDLYDRFIEERETIFIFLTPSGRPPRTATGDAREAFRTLSYPVIIGLLEPLLAAPPPPLCRGREAAVEYLRALRAEFG